MTTIQDMESGFGPRIAIDDSDSRSACVQSTARRGAAKRERAARKPPPPASTVYHLPPTLYHLPLVYPQRHRRPPARQVNGITAAQRVELPKLVGGTRDEAERAGGPAHAQAAVAQEAGLVPIHLPVAHLEIRLDVHVARAVAEGERPVEDVLGRRVAAELLPLGAVQAPAAQEDVRVPHGHEERGLSDVAVPRGVRRIRQHVVAERRERDAKGQAA